MKFEIEISGLLKKKGADLIGFADLRPLSPEIRHHMPRAVAFAVALNQNIIASIENGPTHEYYSEYERVNVEYALLPALGQKNI